MVFQKADFGSKVIEVINENNLKDIEIKTFGYNDCFVEHGKVEELEEKYELNAKNIVKRIISLID